MTGKIFRSILAAVSSVLLAALVIIVGVLYTYFTSAQSEQLKSQLHFAAAGTINEGREYLQRISDEKYRLTLIDTDGSVIYDTQTDADTMDNHAGREEIKSAFETGSGESARFSSTLLEKTMYFAEKLPDGTVLRISATQYSVVVLVLGIIQPLIYIFLIAVIISVFLAKRMAGRIVKPLNELDLDKPLENDAYDEISPLLSHIELQNRKINEQIESLKKSQLEFNAITQNMNEGLVLTGGNKEILSINNAALKLFGADKSCIGKDFLTVERSYDVDKAMENALRLGRGETVFDRNGRKYQVNISRVGEGEGLIGVIILTFDITDKVFAERNRKEFTANVSHELKTPLQSIMGSAELMESGLVKKEDMPRFIGNIRTEAARLVTLIDDIIRLSQLDEKTQMQFEKVDLFDIANEVKKELGGLAESRKVEICLEGEKAEIDAVRRLVREMVFNLCENAVKYNKEGGRVDISVAKTPKGAKIVVSDTGIGIPAEHQSRVFERFYRVDKSRSKETGGTGLGLSIVKHAAEDLGAKIELKSKEGAGTKITVIF